MKYTNLIIILVFVLFLVCPTSAEPAPYIEQGDNILTNFSLQSATQTYTPLGATISGVVMTDDVPANTAEAWNAKLVIPAGQYAMVYTGTIQITFS